MSFSRFFIGIAGRDRIMVLVLSASLVFTVWGCGPEKKDKKATGRLPSQMRYSMMYNEYVGSEECKSCHEQEYNDWEGSDHDRSMMIATDSSVLADFDTTFISSGVTSRFYRKDGKFLVNTEGPDGEYGDFEIIYTFGVRPLQQYIVEFPKGRFQCLRTAWDTEKNKWFDLYPDMKVVHDEWIHWTQGGLNWNTMCSDCHSTLVKKNYDPVRESFNTTYAIINVSCEACHGPGKEHVKITSSEAYKQNPESFADIGKLYMKKNAMPDQLVDDCARCHSLRTQFTEFYDHSGVYMDHYAPDWLRDDVYFGDGQILGEVYVYGSFIQSKMHSKYITCTNCHNIHSLELKFSLEDNQLCLQCHEPPKYDSEKHHFHKEKTEAALCISCHMPGRYYMGNDFRRDHSFRVPRPDLSVKYGVPNTCNTTGCHDDKSAQWASDAIVNWYGPERAKHFSEALAFGRTRDPRSIPALIELAADTTQPGIARASAVMYLRETSNLSAFNTISKLLKDNDPIVRYYSARSIDMLVPEEKAKFLAPLLSDKVRSVRISAMSSMIDVPKNLLSLKEKADYDSAFKEYWTGLQVRADFPGGQMELARYYERTNNIPMAEKSYLRAIALDSHFNPARLNLASIYYSQKRFDEAEALFRKIIEQEPEFGQAYYSVGLLLAEQNKMKEAAEYLKIATEKMNFNDRVFYNYGLVLQKLGNDEEAERIFKKGLQVNADSEAILYALSYLYFQQKRLREAIPLLEKLVTNNPQNGQYQQMLNAIRQQLSQPGNSMGN